MVVKSFFCGVLCSSSYVTVTTVTPPSPLQSSVKCQLSSLECHGDVAVSVTHTYICVYSCGSQRRALWEHPCMCLSIFGDLFFHLCYHKVPQMRRCVTATTERWERTSHRGEWWGVEQQGEAEGTEEDVTLTVVAVNVIIFELRLRSKTCLKNKRDGY